MRYRTNSKTNFLFHHLLDTFNLVYKTTFFVQGMWGYFHTISIVYSVILSSLKLQSTNIYHKIPHFITFITGELTGRWWLPVQTLPTICHLKTTKDQQRCHQIPQTSRRLVARLLRRVSWKRSHIGHNCSVNRGIRQYYTSSGGHIESTLIPRQKTWYNVM